MKRVRLRVAAENDLLEIRRYSEEVWGSEQAERYLDAIDDTLAKLGTGEAHGRLAYGNYLNVRSGTHLIYYAERRGGITVVRVLHEKMDAPRHLP